MVRVGCVSCLWISSWGGRLLDGVVLGRWTRLLPDGKTETVIKAGPKLDRLMREGEE